ncbi:MAG: hypothetical protein JXQ71_02870 [Verrucomicrobia bacterium]|nr:hypothetical protein [Verrucomicrobiota bacterium]
MNMPNRFSMDATPPSLFRCLLLSALVLGNNLGGEPPKNGPRPFSSELDGWVERTVARRPGVPARGEGGNGGSVAEAPADIGARLVERFASIPASAVAGRKWERKAGRAEDHVWAVTVSRDGHGRVDEFAMHLRPDDYRPLYWRAAGLGEDREATFEKAGRMVVSEVLGSRTRGAQVLGQGRLVRASQARIENARGALAAPWERFWFFFVDDQPGANWEHPCRYVFVAEDFSAFAVEYGRTPVTVTDMENGAAGEEDWVLVSPEEAPPPAGTPVAGEAAPATAASPLTYSGSAQNCYAVIISGGIEARQNYQRYWGDSALFYSTLTRKYGYSDDHIFALISDGTNPANDRNNDRYASPVYANSPTDLDDDGDVDTDGSATLANVQATFDTLAGILTVNDQLVVYVTDHGGQESGHDAVIWLWNGDTLRDDELLEMTEDLPCPVMFILETCYSGGFTDDLDQDKQVIGTACAYNDTSVAGTTFPEYDQWMYYFVSALRGFYPGDDPWDDGAVCDADANNDGQVSFKEAFDHAYAHRDAGDVPQYGSNPAALGEALFMNQPVAVLANNTPAVHQAIPKLFSFDVKNYDWCIVGIAPTTDHHLRADDDVDCTSPYQTSFFGGTARDFVVVNGHAYGDTTHYAEVYNGAPSDYTIEAQWEANDLTLGTGDPEFISADEVHEMYEIYLTAGQEVDVTLANLSGTADLALYVFRAARTSGRRGSYDELVNATGAGGDESLSFVADTSGYFGIAVINENGQSGNFNLLVALAPPLPAPSAVSATDGAYTNRIAVSWSSVTGATHYRVYRSTSASSATAAAITGWQTATTYDDTGASVGERYYYWVKAAASSGGYRASGFGASDSGYVAPPQLISDIQVDTVTQPAYYRFRDNNSQWWAVGVRYNAPDENWSLRLYSDSSFTTLLTSSLWNTPVDFVVGDGHHVPYQYRGVEAFRVSGTHDASVEFEGSAETLNLGTNGVFMWTAGDVVEMWDIPLGPGTYQFDLVFHSGSADLSFGLFGSGDGVFFKNRESYLARSDRHGGGLGESFWLTVSATDDYGLCVWAADENSASYSLVITRLEAGLWEGNLSSNWHAAGNWTDNHVPTSTVDVTIPAGTPHSPAISGANGYCRNLTVESGATLTFSTNLYVDRDVVVYGTLHMNNTWSRLYVEDDVFWEAGSTATLVGSARMIIRGDWNFQSGANVQLDTGYTEFVGTGPSWIRSYEAACNLHNLNCSKTGGGYVGVSAQCVDELHVNNIYNYSGSSFVVYSHHPVVIAGFFNNMGGHFQCHYGTIVYTGAAGIVPLKPNTGDYFENLTIRSTTPLSLDSTYANSLRINGDLRLESGGLLANGLDLQVGGSWSNVMGLAGFQASTGTVSFVGSLTDQHIDGETAFHHLVEARSTAGSLEFWGPTTVLSNYTAHFLNSIHTNLHIQGTLDLDDTNATLTLYAGADVTAARLNMGGRIHAEGGRMTASDLVDNAIYGRITMRDGEINLHQGNRLLEYVNLNGDLALEGGRLNVYGGCTDSSWAAARDASLTMTGGILDFHDQGIRLGASAHTFAQSISGGLIRSAEGFLVERTGFTPAGGILELYGTEPGTLRLAPGSHFSSVLINKKSADVTATTDLDIRGDFTLYSGTFTAPTNLLVGGSWSNRVGVAAFAEQKYTVTFTGRTPAGILTDETFFNLIVDKTRSLLPLPRGVYELAMAAGTTVRVAHDLSLQEGCLEMNSGATLDVDHNLAIALDAGLNADDKGVSIYVGGDWQNDNVTADDRHGFDPGYGSTVVFDRAVHGRLATAAPQELFCHVRIDRPGGSFRPADSVVVAGNLTLQNGQWSYDQPDLVHSLRGNVLIAAGGSWADHTPGGAVRFDGFAAQSLQALSTNSYFVNVIVDKNPVDPGLPVAPLQLLSDILSLNDGALTVEKGVLELNGHLFRCTGNVTVHKGGRIALDPDARLEVGDRRSLTVYGLGELHALGAPDHPALVISHSGAFALVVETEGTISAEHATFQDTAADGVHVKEGALIDPLHPFHHCTFIGAVADGTLLTVNNDQRLTIFGAQFPVHPGGRLAANVRKDVKLGSLRFVHSGGAFAGETHDNDPYDLIDWHSGALTSLAIDGPVMATLGGTYTFDISADGDLPLTPITYYYNATDLPPVTHTLSALSDSLDLAWTTAGPKTLLVTASNAVNSLTARHDLHVAALAFTNITFHRADGSNWITLALEGTSADSTYAIQWTTNLTRPAWAPASPTGTGIPGQDGHILWTDAGGPGRDLTVLSNLYYRALLE